MHTAAFIKAKGKSFIFSSTKVTRVICFINDIQDKWKLHCDTFNDSQVALVYYFLMFSNLSEYSDIFECYPYHIGNYSNINTLV